MTLGVGAGQMNRVGAAKIALEQAGERAKGAALASDAFFPMEIQSKQQQKQELQQLFNQVDQFEIRLNRCAKKQELQWLQLGSHFKH